MWNTELLAFSLFRDVQEKDKSPAECKENIQGGTHKDPEVLSLHPNMFQAPKAQDPTFQIILDSI